VVVDLSEATFIDSSVLRALYDARHTAMAEEQHRLALVAPTGEFPRCLLDLVGIPSQVQSFETRAAAIKALTPPDDDPPD
jgi:anti-anti-sigma regulatory factor